MPKADLECLRTIKGFENFDPSKETLYMIKPIYGLKDAPRAWRKKFHQVLIQWMSCRQLYSEPELYCVHDKNQIVDHNPITRAIEHTEEQQESGITRTLNQQLLVRRGLLCLLSVHVGDIKARLGARSPGHCWSI